MRCNQEHKLINYRKLIPQESQQCKDYENHYIHSQKCSYIIIRILSINNQYNIYTRKKIDIFMKYLYSNSFIKLDSFYDWCIEVMLRESIQGFSTKDIHIQQKALFIISYIYQKAIVKENCSYGQQKVLFVIELQILQKVMFIMNL